MKQKKPILALQDLLDVMRVKQVMTFDECNALILFMNEATDKTPWPGMSGNEIAAFANLVIARYSEKTQGATE